VPSLSIFRETSPGAGLPPGLRDAIFGRVLFAGVGLLSVGFFLFGARILLNYESTPGTPAVAPSQWPSNSRIARPSNMFTLMMLAHPDCPCTRASLAELEILMAQLQNKLVAFVLFSKPGASTREVETSDLWKKAAMIPGVSVLHDGAGAGIEQFGGHVSGQTMLYDLKGRLIFSGGITSGRGHQGDNYGVEAIVHRVRGDAETPAHTPVFGCALHDPSAATLREDASWKK
jgi:hypothetical protein